MYAIGIDMGKTTFHAAFSDASVTPYPNTREGFELLLHALTEKGWTQRTTTIGVEATGVYHLPLVASLTRVGWRVVIINPLIASRAIANTSLRRVKTDRKDATVIRSLVLQGKGYPYCDTDEVRTLQALCTQRLSLVRMRAQCKQRLHAHTVRAEAIIAECLPEPYTRLIEVFTREIRSIELLLKHFSEHTQTLLRTIPGIGAIASAMLVAYVGDIERFATTDQLAAYIGIDPRVHESGTSVHGKGYISKRGNVQLRQVLFSAAFIAQRHDPDLRAYYVKKRSEGKHHFAVLCAIERRIVNRIFAVWKRGTPYEKTVKS